MFGLTFEKLLVLCVVAALILGPRRLPDYARSLARFTRSARERWENSRETIEQDLGVSLQSASWERLDPRRYDPRRIIRDALREPTLAPDHTTPVAAEIAASDTVVEAEPTPNVAAPPEQPSPPTDGAADQPRPLASPSLTGRGTRYRVSGSAAHPWRAPVEPSEPADADEDQTVEVEPHPAPMAATAAAAPTEHAAAESARPYAPQT